MNKGVALITGASRGIGKGIALALAREGYIIAGLATCPDPGNTQTGLYAVKKAVEQLGGVFVPLAGDIACLDEHERILQEALDHCGRVDVLVNNAGVAPLQRRDLLECRPDSYDRVLNINLRGPFFFTQHVARQMIRQIGAGSGPSSKIIFITSISSRVASINRAEYCVSKSGLSMTAQCFAVALAPYGINVYDLQPGIIATDMSATARENMTVS